MSLVNLKHVSKAYKLGDTEVHALRDVSIDIEKGSFVSVVGPSGSGKTTLLNIIGCLTGPTEGDVTIGGKSVTQLNRRDSASFRGSHIGYIFQSFNLIPVLTVYENIEYPLLIVKNSAKKENKEKILTLLERVGMLDQKDKRPHQLSGGQRQRVAIARALVTDPDIVLADEPTANLDHETAYKILDTMRKIKDSLNTTFIFSTHDPKIVDRAEVVFRLEDGLLASN